MQFGPAPAMTTRSAAPVHIDARQIAVAAVLTAAVVGLATAVDPRYGIMLAVAACYAPLVFLNLELSLILWVPLVFLEGVRAFNLGSKAAALLIIAAWLPLIVRGRLGDEVIARQKGTFLALALLIAWLTLSAVWSADPGHVYDDAWHWWAVALLFLVVATSVTSRSTARAVCIAFVVGAVGSELLGFVGGNITSTTTATADALVDEARLGGGAGNPNLLATGLVPAIVVVAGLAATTQNRWWRAVAVVTALFLTGGLAATQSRGGILAALATVVAALIFFRRRRLYVLGTALVVMGMALAWLSANPDAWKRISSFNNGGSGRSDLWTVAWRVFQDHPVVGAGLNNFEVVAGDYVRRPGVLQRGDLITEHPHVVHNTYLQLLAENGVVGCALFLLVVCGCLFAAWKAGMIFEAQGDAAFEALARAVLVGGISILVAGFFGSYGVDRRLWILFALGPALLHVSNIQRPPPVESLHWSTRR